MSAREGEGQKPKKIQCCRYSKQNHGNIQYQQILFSQCQMHFLGEDKEPYEQGQISFQKEFGYEYWIKLLSITGAGSDTTAS